MSRYTVNHTASVRCGEGGVTLLFLVIRRIGGRFKRGGMFHSATNNVSKRVSAILQTANELNFVH